jgi:hypothetical protein
MIRATDDLNIHRRYKSFDGDIFLYDPHSYIYMTSLRRTDSSQLRSEVFSEREADDDVKAAERNAKFKAWLTNKSLRDRAIELLGKLSTRRAEEDTDLKEVGIALNAVDEILRRSGVYAINPSTGAGASAVPGREGYDQIDKKTEKKLASSGPKPLRSYWMKWAMETHNFNMVELTEEEVNSLSAAVKEYLDTSEPGKTILPSLKYFFPAVPKKPGDKVKPLTNDQRVQNLLYLKNMQRLWKEAKEELRSRVDEYVARKSQQMSKAAAESSNVSLTGRDRYEMQALNEMSLRQLNLWVEEDEDKANKLANDDEEERLRTAKISHEQWVRSKDR